MEMTPRLGLPLLVAGQVQKELFHNEALALVDLLLAGSVEAGAADRAAAEPGAGRLLSRRRAGASGAFAGHESTLAGWSAGGWRFVVPVEGMRLTERASGVELAFRGGAWTQRIAACERSRRRPETRLSARAARPSPTRRGEHDRHAGARRDRADPEPPCARMA